MNHDEDFGTIKWFKKYRNEENKHLGTDCILGVEKISWMGDLHCINHEID